MKTRDKVLEDRYLQKGETENDMYQRVAQHLATTNQEAVEFYDVMSKMLFLPNCVSEGTYVDLQPIEHCTTNQQVFGSKIIETYDHAMKPGIKITTSKGYTIIASMEHAFKVIEDGVEKFVQGKDIGEGTIMLLQREFAQGQNTTLLVPDRCGYKSNITIPDTLDIPLATFLGLWQGDGSLNPNGIQIAFDNKDTDLIEYTHHLMQDYFDGNPCLSPCGQHAASRIDINSVWLKKWFISNGFITHRTEIPNCILSSTPDIIAAFLSGYFEADGTVFSRGIILETVQQKVAYQVQLMLLGIGIVANVRHVRGMYRVQIFDNESKQVFASKVGFISERKQLNMKKVISDNRGTLRIYGFKSSWRPWFDNINKSIAYSEIADLMRGDRDVTEHRFNKLAKRCSDLKEHPIYSIIQRKLTTDNVISIEPIDNIQMYDIQTSSHWYVANGFVTHNSPTLVNAGSDRAGGYSACYVLPIDDDIDSIYKTLKDHALIHKAFGGTGLNFSKIRPEGDTIKSTGGRATGPIGFINLFDANASAIKQGGHREGANMAILNVSHPDIEKFINAEFDHFNSSVGVTDAFMEVVRDNKSWRLHFDGKSYCNISARALFQKICNAAWKSGNPGIVFLDRIQEFNPTPDEVMNATNPCGEQMLLPYESCNLGSINLSKMVIEEEPNTVDWQLLDHTVSIAVSMLDAVIDKNEYPLEEVREKTLATRKIGLGVMGWHDMLIHMGIAYDSSEALELADKVMEFITNKGVAHSIDRGVDIGVFPNWENSIWNDKQVRMRNATVTTIAPTGTLSIIAECSSGIEPVYDWEYVRNIESGTFVERHPTADLAEAHELTDTAKDISWKAHIRMQAAFQKHVHNAVSKTINMKNDAIVDDVKWAYEMAYETGCKGVTIYRDGSRDEQVLSSIDDMKHNPPLLSTDGSVTSGQMIFNDTNQPLGFISSEQKTDNERPKTVSGKTTKCTSGCGSLFVTTNVVDGKPYELFVHHSDGGCQSNMEAIGRLISLALKEGIEVDEIVGQLSKIKCSNAIRSSKSEGDSCSQIIGKQLISSMEDKNSKHSEHISAIAGTKLKIGQIVTFVDDTIVSVIPDDDLFERILADNIFMDEYTAPPIPTIDDNEFVNYGNKCPECGDKLDFGEGCNQGMCRNCGWSGCN